MLYAPGPHNINPKSQGSSMTEQIKVSSQPSSVRLRASIKVSNVGLSGRMVEYRLKWAVFVKKLDESRRPEVEDDT